MSKAEKVSRRKILAGAAALLGSSSSVSVSGSVVSNQSEAQDGRDPTKVQGRLASEIGQRSRFEQPQRTVPGAGTAGIHRQLRRQPNARVPHLPP